MKKTHTASTNHSIKQDKVEREEALQVITELEIAQSRIIQSLNERMFDLRKEIEALKKSSNLAQTKESYVSPTGILSGKPVALAPLGAGKGSSTYEKSELSDKNGKKDKLLQIVFLVSIMAFFASSASYTLGFLTTQDSSSTVESNIAFDQSLGVYTDSRCTQNLTCIDWGTILPGENVSYILYARNLGNKSFTLQLQTLDLSPSLLSADVLLTWDYRGQVMEPTDVVPIVLSLSVSPDIENVNTFTHNIVLTTRPIESS